MDGCTELETIVLIPATFETVLILADVNVLGVDVVLWVFVPLEFGTVTFCVVETRLDAKETKGTVVDTPSLILDEVVALDVVPFAVVTSVVVVEAKVP